MQSPELSDEVDDENVGLEEFVEYEENQGISDEENLEVVVEPHDRYIYQFEEAIFVHFFHFLVTDFFLLLLSVISWCIPCLLHLHCLLHPL